MHPNVWGNCGWKFIHIITISYPVEPTEEDKKNYYDYFMALQNVLPCERCRMNMKNHLNELPLTDSVLSCKTKLVKWAIDFHNVVNKHTGKKVLSYEEALNEIDKMVNPSKNFSIGMSSFFLISLLFGLLIIKKLKY